VANRIKIEFTFVPSPFYNLVFTVYNTAIGYTKTISKVFVAGTPTASNQVQMSGTLAGVITNLIANLNANDLDGNISFEADIDGVFYLNFANPVVYSYTESGNYLNEFTSEDLEDLVHDTLDDLDIKHFQILIYDTYLNTRPLILEFAKENSCKIKWDGGDDLYKSIMASNLVFDMLVANYEDAHFKHLFTGDEQRYQIELNAISDAEVVQLVWQGFLLPDQYNERYTNNNLFVDFTATDMISSMKGKYFDPWYYDNKLPIAEVIALALKNTGLQQNLIVKPVLVPASASFEWQTINVDMRAFLDNGKYKDCYSIVESVLQSQGLTIYSFRGYWWIEGCSRKHEATATALQFDADGKRIVDIDLVKREVDAFMQSEAPDIAVITPWRAVNVGFKVDGTKNIFSDTVASIESSKLFYSFYKPSGYSGIAALQEQYLGVIKIKKWNENLSANFLIRDYNDGKNLIWNINFFTVDQFNYNYTEAMALNNYIECPDKPYVEPNILYEFNAVFNITGLGVHTSTFIEKLNAGYYDKLIPFQLFVNGLEKYSNRPSFNPDVDLRYDIQETDNSGSGSAYNLKYSLKFNFKVDIPGNLSLRILMPIFQRSLGGGDSIDFPNRIDCEKLQLTAIEGIDENNDVIAARAINYTQELDYDIDVSCTIDNSVINSFGLGFPINDDYFHTIDRTDDNVDVTTNHYFNPAADLHLNFSTWKIPFSLQQLLFANNRIASLFIEKVSGQKSTFSSVWYGIRRLSFPTVPRMGFLKTYDGFPIIPKTYKAYPDVVEDDVLKYMNVEYATENYSNRLNWKLVGSDVVDSYPKTLARALHGVQPEQLYRLEATQYGVLFPNDLLNFYFDNESRNFIPTRIDIDLFNSKTGFTALEAKFVDLESEITYE